MNRKRKPAKELLSIDLAEHPRLRVLFNSADRILNGCIVWNKHRDRDGYGQLWLAGRAHWAHRVFYVLFNGPLLKGVTVHHTCNNPSCINPEHLQAMRLSDNIAEANRRMPRGAVREQSETFRCPRCGGIGTVRDDTCTCWNCGKPFEPTTQEE